MLNLHKNDKSEDLMIMSITDKLCFNFQVAKSSFQFAHHDKPKYTPVTMDNTRKLELQKAILETDGCVVAARTVCRRKKARISEVIKCMQDMTVSQEEADFVGSYSELSKAVHAFYKCPPNRVDVTALDTYGIVMEDYVELYFRNPRPLTSGPSNWPNYVDMLVRYCPFGPSSFPLDSMGLEKEEKQNILIRLSGCAQGLDVHLDAILTAEDTND